MTQITIVLHVPPTDLPERVLIASALREIAGPILDGALEGKAPVTKMLTSVNVHVALAVHEDPEPAL